jgi:hypothetical protein
MTETNRPNPFPASRALAYRLHVLTMMTQGSSLATLPVPAKITFLEKENHGHDG